MTSAITLNSGLTSSINKSTINDPEKLTKGALIDDHYKNLQQMNLEEGGFIDTAVWDPRSLSLGGNIISFKENNLKLRLSMQKDHECSMEEDQTLYTIKRLFSHVFEVG